MSLSKVNKQELVESICKLFTARGYESVIVGDDDDVYFYIYTHKPREYRLDFRTDIKFDGSEVELYLEPNIEDADVLVSVFKVSVEEQGFEDQIRSEVHSIISQVSIDDDATRPTLKG